MPVERYIFRDWSATAPALGLAQSFWALQMRELSLEASLERATADGYLFLEAGLSAERMSVLRTLLRLFPLQLIAQGWATTPDEAEAFLERAVELGAVAINFHLGHAFLRDEEAMALIQAVQEKAASFGLPMLLETHRGRLTQDLMRTAALVAKLPDLLLTLDVSHYLVAGEGFGGSSDHFFRCMHSLSTHAALVHGRISDGQGVQVRSADPFALTDVVCRIWTEAMRGWLKDAPDYAVFVFEPELGPPPYAARRAHGVEVFSRTDETAELVRLARTCWRNAQEKASSHHE